MSCDTDTTDNDFKSLQRIDTSDVECLTAVLTQVEKAQKAAIEAQEFYVKSLGAKEFVAERLQAKYSLKASDQIQADGTIVRAE